ncbi:DUF4276 family protein [Ectothiorhodospira shaposhnikovii]|uniref:DUF4276 family protein n=1 Tax=Ectothiorhodospira shaposhnikovii TaxID=1054 RepID=UPI00399FE958
MIRVHVICEGQTEEMFVNELLAPAMLPKGIQLIPALVGKPGHKGGNFKFQRLLVDVKNRLLGDRTAYCTTFFDYYGLPQGFPGKGALPGQADIRDKAQVLQNAMFDELKRVIGEDPMRRFLPFVQIYEFEALLFSDPQSFAQGIDQPSLAVAFSEIRDSFDTPEHINNSPITAPSKRIMRLVPGYEKPLMGSLAALEVGLDAMRKHCVLFNDWLMRIESLLANHDPNLNLEVP